MYVDTSVFGGAFDAEFERASKEFFRQILSGSHIAVVSALVEDELRESPAEVNTLYQSVASIAEQAFVDDYSNSLAEAYLAAGILTARSIIDASHVALATIANCSAIVSWNFRDIVHFEKIPLYNAVNRIHGYNEIGICSPFEVIDYGNE